MMVVLLRLKQSLMINT